MKRVYAKINTIEDMTNFILNATGIDVHVYKDNLEINGSSIIAMINFIGEKILVVYPTAAAPFNNFINKFTI